MTDPLALDQPAFAPQQEIQGINPQTTQSDSPPMPETTKLSDKEEAGYNAWREKIGMTKENGMKIGPDGNGTDYDLKGFYKQNGPADVNVKGGQHFSDEFKLPNHDTFSDQSKYATPEFSPFAGSWHGSKFNPPSEKYGDPQSAVASVGSNSAEISQAQSQTDPTKKTDLSPLMGIPSDKTIAAAQKDSRDALQEKPYTVDDAIKPQPLDTSVKGDRFSRSMTDATTAPTANDINLLKENNTPEVRAAFEDRFGKGGALDAIKPVATPNDIQLLKENLDKPAVWQAYEQHFGALPKGIEPTQSYAEIANDLVVKDAASALRTFAGLRTFLPSNIPTGKDLVSGGKTLQAEAKARFDKDLDDPSLNWTNKTKAAANALVATAQQGAGALLEGAGDSYAMRFADFLRSNLHQTASEWDAVQQRVHDMPPEQSQGLTKALTGNLATPEQLGIAYDLHREPGFVNKIADNMNAAADEAEAKQISPAGRRAMQKAMLGDNLTAGPGLSDPKSIMMNVSGMVGMLGATLGIGGVAKVVGYGAGYANATETLAKVDMPIAAKEALTNHLADVGAEKAGKFASQMAGGGMFAEQNAQQVQKQIDAMSDADIAKIPAAKAILDAHGTPEMARIAAAHDAHTIALVGGFLSGAAAMPSLTEGLGAMFSNVTKVKAATLAAGHAIESTAVGAGVGAAGNVTTQAALNRPLSEGTGEAAVSTAVGVAGTHVPGLIGSAARGVGDIVKGKPTADAAASAAGAGIDAATHGALQDILNGNARMMDPSVLKPLQDQGLIAISKQTKMPMVLPAGRRAIADYQEQAKRAVAPGATDEPNDVKGQPGTEENPEGASKVDLNQDKVQPTSPKVTEEGQDDTRAPRTPDEATDEAGAGAAREQTKQEQMDEMHASREAEIKSHMGDQRDADYPKALNEKGDQEIDQANAEPEANRAMTTMRAAMEMTQKTQTQLRDTIPRADSLSPENRNIESRFIEDISNNLPSMIERYKTLPNTDGGRIINTDEVRLLSSDYAADHNVSAAVHEPASWLAGVMYKRALAEPLKPGHDNVVMMTAGGTGSGKSSTMDLAHMGAATRSAQIIFDTAMNSPETALDKVQAARSAGKGVIIHYVYRDPLKSFTEGSLPRSMENGRTVPVEAHQETHDGAPKAIRFLMDHFKDDPMVQFVATHNHSDGTASAIDPTEAIKLKSKVSLEDLRSAAKEALKDGTITPEIYERTTGQPAPGSAGAEGKAGGVRAEDGADRVGSKDQGGEGLGGEGARAKLDRIEQRANRRFAEEKQRRKDAASVTERSRDENNTGRSWQDLMLKAKSLGQDGVFAQAMKRGVMGIKEFLEKLSGPAKDVKNDAVSGVIDMMLKNATDAPMHVVDVIKNSFGQEIHNADGLFNPTDGSIQVTKRALRTFAGARIAMHEILHQQLWHFIENNPTHPAVEKLHELLEEARDLARADLGKKFVDDHISYHNGISINEGITKPAKYNRDLYGLTDLHEFTSEIMTSPRFQTLLDHLDNAVRGTLSIDDPLRMKMSETKPVGLVQRVVDAITSAFKPRTDRETRLIQDTIYHISKALDAAGEKARAPSGLTPGAATLREDLNKAAEAEKDKMGKDIADDLGKNKLSKLVMAAADLGALKLVRGVVKFEEWSAQMVKQFGRGIKPALQSMFEISKDKTRDIKTLIYKKGKDGRYVGGPAGLGRDDLATLRATIRKLAKEGADYKHWYDESSQAVLDAVGGNIAEAKKLAGLLSIFSSGAAVNGNTTMALRAWYQHQNGMAIDTGTTANDEVAQRWLDFGKEPDGMKKSNFYGNLLLKLSGDKSEIFQGGVTVDRWMMRALGYAKDAPTDPQYAFVSDQIRKVAKDLGWEPEQAQAAVWVAIKARWEDIRKEGNAEATEKGWIHKQKDVHGISETVIDDPERYYGMMLKRSLGYALPKESMARAGANYRSELVKHRGQISWEALPSTESGKLLGMQHLPIEVQAQFQHDTGQALINPKTGNDQHQEALGMLSVGHIDGNSAWFNAPGQIMRFRHWSTQGDLTTVDPAFMGKGVSSWKERGRTNRVTSLYPYESTSEQPEKLVTSGAPHQYIAEIPAERLYDASRDPLGFKQAAMEPIGIDGTGAPTDFAYNHDTFESAVKSSGFMGYYISDAGDDALMQGQARLFEPWPVTPVDKFVNFDGYSKAGAQEVIYAPMEKGAALKKGDVKVDENARAILESYAAELGMQNHQNSVGWHRPRSDGLVREQNGMAVHLTNASTDDYLRAYKAVSDAAKLAGVPHERAMEFAPVQSPEGFRFLNWGTMDNKEFQKMVRATIAEHFPDADITPFAADGGLISNDWTVHKNGEQYAQVIAKNGHSADLAESHAAVGKRLEAVYAKYAERLGTEQRERGSAGEHPDQDGQLGPPISLDRLTGKNGDLQKDIRGRFGKMGDDLRPAGKLYDLAKLVADPKLAEDFAQKLGFGVELFSFTSDPSTGVEFRLPKLGKNGYEGGKLWLYDPRVGAASFHDADYTRAWRISHELGHALTEHFMQAKYGDSFRYGRLGQTMQVERGGAGKQKMVDQRPLTLAEAQRAVEWEDVAFRMQRAILEKLGVLISDSDFAKEYNGNISDAMYRVHTGDFTDLDGLIPSDKLPDLKSTLGLLESSEGTLAKSQGREPSVGLNLRAWSPISDADIKAALENRMSGARSVKFAAREEYDYNVVARTKAGDEVEGPHSELTFGSNEDAHDYVDTNELPPGADHFAVQPISRNPFRNTPRAKDGKAPSSAMRAEFESKYPEIPGSIGERLVNGNVSIGVVSDPYDGGTMYVSHVHSLEPGRGAGTKAMADVVGLADKHGVALELNAVPLDPHGIQDEKLIAWYKKLGFVEVRPEGTVQKDDRGFDMYDGPNWNSGLMRREPLDTTKFAITPFATNEGHGITDAEAQQVIDHSKRMFPDAQHHIAQSIEDAPAEVQAEAAIRGLSDRVMAAYVREPDGTHIWLIQNNATSVEDALHTLIQENVGHDGIIKTFGADVGNLMDGFLRNDSLRPSIMRMAANEGLNINGARDPIARREVLRAAAEEWLAHAARDEMLGAKSPVGMKGALEKVISAVKIWAATKGLPITLSRADAIHALERADRYVKSGNWTNRITEAKEAAEASKVKFAVKPPAKGSDLDDLLSNKMGAEPAGWRTKLSEAMKDLRSKTVVHGLDRMYRVLQYERDMQTPAAESGYISARLSTNVAPLLRNLIEFGGLKWTSTLGFDPDKSMMPDYDPGIKPLNQILSPLGNDPEALRQFKGYLLSLRSNELMKEGRENNLTQKHIDAGLDLARQNPHFVQMQKDIAKLNKSMLDFAEKAGIIDPESRKMWESDYYTPLYRVTDDATAGPWAAGSLAKVRNPIMRLTGSEKNTDDIMGNIIRNWSTLINASMKAHAARVAIDNLLQSGMVERMPGLEASGSTLVSTSEINKILAAHGITEKMSPSSMGAIQKLMTMSAPKGDDVVQVWRGGKREYYQMHDPLLAQGFAALQASPLSALSKDPMGRFLTGAARGAKSLFTKATVDTPIFGLRTLFKDNINAWTVGRGMRPVTPVVSAVTGLLKTVKAADSFRRMAAAGATFNAGRADPYDTNLTSTRYTTKQSALATAWDAYRDTMAAGENASRVTIYERTLQETGSHKLAAFEARDLMDYAMRGSSPIVQFFVETVPFWGAHVQGIYRTARSFSDGRTTSYTRLAAGVTGQAAGLGVKIAASKILAPIALKGMLLSLASVGLMMHNMANPMYNELTDLQKEMSYHIFAGNYHVKIPKAFESGTLFGTIPEAAATALLSGDAHVALEQAEFVGHALLNGLNLNPTPQIIKPFAELATNSDWSNNGTPVLSTYDQKLVPQEQVGPSTSPLLTSVARHMPNAAPDFMKSPKQLQFLVNQMMGMSSVLGLDAADYMYRKVSGDPVSPDRNLGQIPVVGSFVTGNEPPASTRSLQELNRVMKASHVIQDTIHELMKEGTEESIARGQKLMDDNLAEYTAAEDMKPAADAIKNLQDIKRKVILDPDLSGAEKRQQVNELQKSINDSAAEVYESRPGAKINSQEVKDDLAEATTMNEKSKVLIKHGMPNTAILVAQLGKRMPASVRAAIEEVA